MAESRTSNAPRIPTMRQTNQTKPIKERLSLDRIVEVALAQMKERGYDSVSMRTIAKELGTGPASLYAHVANREELDQLVTDKVAGLVAVPEPDPARWDEQLSELLRQTLEVFRDHPGAARATMGMIPTGPGALRTAEAMMALCRAGGVPDQYAAWACDMFSLFVSSVVAEEDIWVERGRAAAASGRPYTEEEIVGRLREHFASLDPAVYPVLSSAAAALTTGTGDDRVEFALELLVAGLKTMAQREARAQSVGAADPG